jgi:cystathionine gamma-lyase
MSPVLQNPLKLGADIVMHSLTKYIGGHSDVLGGAIMLDSSELYDKLYFNLKAMGTTLAPFECWLALRGAKTLHARVEKSSSNALKIAKFLEAHPKVERVLYPGLPSHPQHKIALKNRASVEHSGGSGIFSFYIRGDFDQTKMFL